MLTVLVILLMFWMGACVWAGAQARYLRFGAILLAGLALNALWMVFGLQARPFEFHALVAQASVTLYALCAFGAGWFGGRIRRAWHDSRVVD